MEAKFEIKKSSKAKELKKLFSRFRIKAGLLKLDQNDLIEN